MIRVFLHDEIPALGSGWRWLNARERCDYVKLRDAMGRTARVKAEVWKALVKESDDMTERIAA